MMKYWIPVFTGMTNKFVNLSFVLLFLTCGICFPESGEGDGPKARSTLIGDITRKRPVFYPALYSGHPSLYAEGASEGKRDYDRISLYFDPLVQYDYGSLDSLSKDEKTNADFIKGYQEYIDTMAEAGLQSAIHTHMAIVCGWAACIPEWYKTENPDWEEMELGTGRKDKTTCIAHPNLYSEVIYPYIDNILAKLPDISSVALWYLESEPGLIKWGSFTNVGANPHTKRLFQEYLENEALYELSEFNAAAGTTYKSFSEIDTADDNYLVKIELNRFRAWMNYGYYQKRIVDRFKDKFPNTPIVTRWCDFGGGGEYDERDPSYFDRVNADYLGFTYYAGRGPKKRAIIGKLSSNMSFLRNYQRPIGLVEWNLLVYGKDNELIHRAFTPEEFVNYVYRSLYYNVRLYALFSWLRPGLDYDGSNLCYYPESLNAVRQVRAELDRIKPYERFGGAQPNEVAVIISRNGNGFPIFSYGNNNHYYGDVWNGLSMIMEDPAMSYFDIIEEHSGGATYEKLEKYKGIIVYDACLEAGTRKTIEILGKAGKPILVIGTYKYVDKKYKETPVPSWYPVNSIKPLSGGKEKYYQRFVGTPKNIAKLDVIDLAGVCEVELKAGASTLITKRNNDSVVAGAMKDNVIYICGVPTEVDQRTELYAWFLKRCNAKTYDLYVSRFEHALVLNNFKSWMHDDYGKVKTQYPWFGSMEVGRNYKQIREARGDYPWLAYSNTNDGTRIEGIFIDTCGVRVFQEENGKEQPHFEGVPDGIGFEKFMLGNTRMRGVFRVNMQGEYGFNFTGGFWGQGKIKWVVCREGEINNIAEGQTAQINFKAQPDISYYVEVSREE